jgi:hypothetical protein
MVPGSREGMTMGIVTQSGRPLYASSTDLTEGGNADLAKTFQNLASQLEGAGFDQRYRMRRLMLPIELNDVRVGLPCSCRQ